MRENIFLKVSLWKRALRFRKQGKLIPRYIGPYEIIRRIRPLAYRLALPVELSMIHNVFHVSMLWRYRLDPNHIVQESKIEISETLNLCGRTSGNFRSESEVVEKQGDTDSEG